MIVAIAVLGTEATGREVSANGASRFIVKDARAGPYFLRVGILPGTPKVGLLHISILVQDVSGGVITDATVLLTATGPEPNVSPVHVQAFSTLQSPQLYEGNLTLDVLGSWTLNVDTESPLGRGTLDVPLQVTETGGFNLLFLVIGVAGVLIVGSVIWSRSRRVPRFNSKGRSV
jgi:hypothetical protein